MIKNDYNIELSRLNQINSVDIPHLENVRMIVKNRVDAHSYDPIVFDHLKGLKDEPHMSNDLAKLRAGSEPTDVPDIAYPGVKVDVKYTAESNRHVKYLQIYHQDNADAKKALVYVHGGAYYAGTAEDTLPFLRLLASKFHGVIYSVDYGLAPENPYPAGVEDCLAVLTEVSKGFDQVSLAGDSAGASIALGVSQMSHNMGICEIYQHILFYPTVVHGSDHEGSLWNDCLIPINPDQKRILHNNYLQFEQLDTIMTDFYLDKNNYDVQSPILSPLYADPLIFKKVVVMTGEFDPFRLQDEAFVQKIGMAGCEATYIRYGGLAHAYLNYVGRIPAVEDAITECAKFLN